MSSAASTASAANTPATFEPLSIGEVAQRIVLIRGQRVVLRSSTLLSRFRRFPAVTSFQIKDLQARFGSFGSGTL
jgi:hypothetical protein